MTLPIPRTRVAATWLLIATLILSAFAFGSTETWAESWLRAVAWSVLALALWSRPTPAALPAPARVLALPALLVFVLGAVQLVPLPRGLVAAVSPGTAELYQFAVPPRNAELGTWLMERPSSDGERVDPAAGAIDLPEVARGPTIVGRSLSVAPRATVRSLATWSMAVALFLAAASLGTDPWLRYKILWGITGAAGLMGVVGLAQKVSWNGQLLWFRERIPGTLPLGPFVNPSHYAGWIAMAGVVAIGLSLALVSRGRRGAGLVGFRVALLKDSWTVPRLLLAGGASVFAVAGLVASHSRGGWLAFGTAMVFLVVGRRSRAWAAVAIVAVCMVGLAAGLVAWVGSEDAGLEAVPFVVGSADPSGALRLSAWGSTLEIVKDHPLVGSGLGTFRWVFPRYQRAGEWKEWQHAHNDYVEWFSETGVAGAILLLAGLAVLARHVLVSVLGGGARRWTSISLCAAMFAMLVHSVVDFNLRIPSNLAMFAVIVGLLAAAAADPAVEDTEAS